MPPEPNAIPFGLTVWIAMALLAVRAISRQVAPVTLEHVKAPAQGSIRIQRRHFADAFVARNRARLSAETGTPEKDC